MLSRLGNTVMIMMTLIHKNRHITNNLRIPVKNYQTYLADN